MQVSTEPLDNYCDFDSLIHAKKESTLALNYSKEMIDRLKKKKKKEKKRPCTPVRIAIIGSGLNLDHPFLRNSKVISRIHYQEDVVREDLRSVKDASPKLHGTKVFSVYCQLFEDCPEMVEFVNIKAVNNEGYMTSESLNKAIVRLLEDDMKDVSIVSISSGIFEKIASGVSEERKIINLELRQNMDKLKLEKIVVAAASNSGAWKNDSVSFPASLVISIGSTGECGERTNFTPTGQDLDFLTLGTHWKVANEGYDVENQLPHWILTFGTSFSVAVAVSYIAHFLFQYSFHFKGILNVFTFILIKNINIAPFHRSYIVLKLSLCQYNTDLS